MKRLFGIASLALCVGCASTVVRPYDGEQQNWPTSSRGIVSTRYELPVFASPPPVPYDIIAAMRTESPFKAQSAEGNLAVLVKKAKSMGANALMFVDSQTFFSTNYGPRPGTATDSGKPAPVTRTQSFNSANLRPGLTFVAIKWISEPPTGLSGRAAKAPEAVTPAESAPVVPESPKTELHEPAPANP